MKRISSLAHSKSESHIRDKFRCSNAHREGGYHFTDVESIRKERRALWDFIRSLGSGVWEGRSLVSISLPVYIFEPRSFLQRLTDNWSYIHFLDYAAKCKNPIERMLNVVAFGISGLHMTCIAKKPFNPIIGETFQAQYKNGTRVYCEQTSHHPPISHWQVVGEEYILSGYGGWEASTGANTVKGQQTGPTRVTFNNDGTTIEWRLPQMQLCGIIWGDRKLEYLGEMHFTDHKHHLHCKITFNPYKQRPCNIFKAWWRRQQQHNESLPSDFIRGELKHYRYYNINSSSLSSSSSSSLSSSSSYHHQEFLGLVEGTWLGYLDWVPATQQTSMISSKLKSKSKSTTKNRNNNENNNEKEQNQQQLKEQKKQQNQQNQQQQQKEEEEEQCVRVPSEQRLWSMKTQEPEHPSPVSDPLPSDVRFRPDLQQLAHGDVDRAQRAKEDLEDQQRHEERLRKKKH